MWLNTKRSLKNLPTTMSTTWKRHILLLLLIGKQRAFNRNESTYSTYTATKWMSTNGNKRIANRINLFQSSNKMWRVCIREKFASNHCLQPNDTLLSSLHSKYVEYFLARFAWHLPFSFVAKFMVVFGSY